MDIDTATASNPTMHILLYFKKQFSRSGNNFQLGNVHSAMQYTDEVDCSLQKTKQEEKENVSVFWVSIFFTIAAAPFPPPQMVVVVR